MNAYIFELSEQSNPKKEIKKIALNSNKFTTTYVSYDRYYTHEKYVRLPDELLNDNNELICIIPSILSRLNAYSYEGIDVALHCYFHFTSIHKNNFWIIIAGIEEEAAFWKHCKYNNILKCLHISYIQYNQYEIQHFIDSFDFKWDIDWLEVKERLIDIQIKPPSSYKSHHSITNEWSIYRWSKCLNIQNIEIQKEINDSLYFKYLKAIHTETDINQIPTISTNRNISWGIHKEIVKTNNNKCEILLIDDEEDKGWDIFFEKLCLGLSVHSIGRDFKSITREKVIESVKATIKKTDPDVVILDLRLLDEDFDNKKPEELTGYAIFNAIKGINKGIQIILFSASNKVWNYIPLKYDGIIIKESPEQSIINGFTENSINLLNEKIENSIQRADKLKHIDTELKKIQDFIINSNIFGDKTDEIISNIDISFELLDKNDFINIKKYWAFSYLQLYIVLESFVQLESIYKISDNTAITFDKYVVAEWKKLEENKYDVEQIIKRVGNAYRLGKSNITTDKKRWLETDYRMSAILNTGYAEKDLSKYISKWVKIRDVRNTKAAHPEKSSVSSDEYSRLIDFMLYILNKNNRHYANISVSLPNKQPIPSRESAIVTVSSGRQLQARLKADTSNRNYPLETDINKPHLKMGQEITVEVIRKNNNIDKLKFVEKK